MFKRLDSTQEPTKRVFVVGAGMSKEVGAPLVGDFWDELLRCVPASRTRDMRLFLEAQAAPRNIEQILSDIDAHIYEGSPISGYTTPALRAIRSSIVNAICDTLTEVQYKFLHRHYGYKRYEDPYFYWVRDFKAVDRVRGRSSKGSRRQEWQVNWERSRLRPGRGLGQPAWDDYETALDGVFLQAPTAENKLYLLSAALAAGPARFIAWLSKLWPLYLYAGCEALRIKERACSDVVKRECISTFLSVLRDPAAKGVKLVNGWMKREIADLLMKWKSKGGITQDLLEECASAFRKDVFPVLIGDGNWVRRQGEHLLSGGLGKINPYLLLAALWKPNDAVISLNYDLFPEMAINTLYSNVSVDYGMRDLIGITPWGEHGEPFYPYDKLIGPSPVTLLKPHGSINWLRCLVCDGMYCTFDMPANTSAARYILRDLAKFSWEQYGGHPCCHLFDPAKVEIPVVPPTAKKTMEFRSLAKIWGEARTQIALAHELVFIGYALSPSDEDVRELIADSIWFRRSGNADRHGWSTLVRHRELSGHQETGKGMQHSRSRRFRMAIVPPSRRPLKVKVVNPSSRDQKRYKRLFAAMDGVQLEFATCGASEYLRREFEDLLAKANRR